MKTVLYPITQSFKNQITIQVPHDRRSLAALGMTWGVTTIIYYDGHNLKVCFYKDFYVYNTHFLYQIMNFLKYGE